MAQKFAIEPLWAAAVLFLLAATNTAHGYDPHLIPSLNAVSASTSGPLFVPYRPPNPYGLQPYFEGPGMRAADPVPPLAEREQPRDVGISPATGPLLGKYFFDPVKTAVEKNLIRAGAREGFAKGASGLFDLAGQGAYNWELPTLLDFAGEFAVVAKFAGGIPLAAASVFLSSNEAGAPELGQTPNYFDFSNISDPGAFYAGSLFGTSGQFIMINTQTPGDWAPVPSVGPGPGPGPGGDGNVCDFCGGREFACWCICFPLDDECCDPDNDPDCSASLLKGLAARKSLKKGILSNAFTPIPKGALTLKPKPAQ